MDFCFGLVATFLILDVNSVRSTAPDNDFTSSASPKIDPPISNLPPLKAPINLNPVRTISELKCKEYMKSAKKILRSFGIDCRNRLYHSLSKRSTITIGTNAMRYEFPHMVALGKGIFNFILMCGGTLISPTWVLSAAHCTHGPNGGPSVARLGFLRLSDQNSSTVTIVIKNTINHPDYNPPAMYADIALIELNKSAMFGTIIPACLYQQNDIMPSQALITGWGFTKIHGKMSDRLQKANLSPIDNLTWCTTWYNNSKEIPYGIAPSMICAGKGGEDTCHGDSGGPLQIVHPETSCIFQVIGITSFGLSCGMSPSIYTRVSYYLPWIEEKVWPRTTIATYSTFTKVKCMRSYT